MKLFVGVGTQQKHGGGEEMKSKCLADVDGGVIFWKAHCFFTSKTANPLLGNDVGEMGRCQPCQCEGKQQAFVHE